MASIRKRLIQDAERVNPIESVHIWRSPPGAAIDMLIVTHLSVYSCIHGQASASLPNETGGFLIGRVSYDDRDGCWHLEIEEAIAVEPESQDPVHFTFTWRDVDRVRSYREEHGKALVGWYHTHPDLGIFLSETDLERTHRILFSEPFQVALVYDPVGGRAGYFFWEGAQAIDASQAAWREFEIAVTQSSAPPPAAIAVPDGPPDAERMAETVVGVPGGALSLSAAAAPSTAARPSPAGDSSGTQSRRLRAELVTDETHAGMPSPLVKASAVALADTQLDVFQEYPPFPDAPDQAPAPRTAWRLVFEVLLVILGLAIGYLWFGSGRGLE